MADTLSAPDWMTPWEAWAFMRILEGESANMSRVPEEASGDTHLHKAPVIWPLLRDDQGEPIKDEDGIFQPAEDSAWPAWQVLSAKFLEYVTMNRIFIEARRRNRVRIFSARFRERLDFGGCHLPGELWLDRCRLDEAPSFRDAEIGGGLSLESSFLPSGLSANGLVTKGDVLLHGGARFDGTVSLLNAEIGSSLDCSGSQFKAGADGNSLQAGGLVTKYNVFLNGGARFDGTVRLLNAEISGFLDCAGSQFKAGADGNSLLAEGLVTKNNVFLNGGARFDGTVRLFNAHIGNTLVCSDSQFKPGSDGKSLQAQGLVTKGDAWLGQGGQFEGQIFLLRARIEGVLLLNAGQFDGVIYLGSAHVAELRLDGTSSGLKAPDWKEKASFDLANADIGVLHGSLAAWQRDGEFIKRRLDGLQVRRFAGAIGGKSLKDAGPTELREWLRNDASFTPSPYLTVAKALTEEGEGEKARSIRIELEKQRTRHMVWQSWSWPMKLFRLAWLGPVTGYGYSAARGVIILFMGIVAFAIAGSVWHAVYTAGGLSGLRLASSGEFLPWLGFSFETAIPLADLDPVHDTFLEDQFDVPVIEALQKKDYNALPTGIRALFMFERFLGLAILATLIASLTGWAEQRGSGE
jgi:hypothetical protein